MYYPFFLPWYMNHHKQACTRNDKFFIYLPLTLHSTISCTCPIYHTDRTCLVEINSINLQVSFLNPTYNLEICCHYEAYVSLKSIKLSTDNHVIQFILQCLITKIKEPEPHTVTCDAICYTEENEFYEMFCFVGLKLMKIVTNLTDTAVCYCHKFISFSVESSLRKPITIFLANTELKFYDVYKSKHFTLS